MRNDYMLSEDTGNTLLELILIDAIESAATKSSNRLRFSANLDSKATRALFSGTEKHLSNAELLRILRPNTSSGVVGRDTKEARHLRSIGAERSLKIDRLKMYAVLLLDNGAIGQADTVRAWAYALIHEAARLSMAELREKLDRVTLDTIQAQPALGNQLLNRCYDILCARVARDFEKSTANLERELPLSEKTRFIDFSVSIVLDAMHQPVQPWTAINNLVGNVYPQLDSYEFTKEKKV